MMKNNKNIKKSLSNTYLQDVLIKRVRAYKTIIKRVSDIIPTEFNKVELITNDSLHMSMTLSALQEDFINYDEKLPTTKQIEYLKREVEEVKSLIVNDSLLDDVLKKIDDEIKGFKKIFALAALTKSVQKFIGKKLKTKNKESYKSFIGSNKAMKSYFVKKQTVTGLSINDMIDNENLENFIGDSITSNVQIIKSMDEKVFLDIQNSLLQNLTGKKDRKKLIEDLQELGAKSVSRAKFIAKDQVNKVYENINNERSKSLGAKKFTWHTSGKNNVRPEHDSFNKKEYSYDKGAGSRGILPGEDPGCECIAIPKFEGMD